MALPVRIWLTVFLDSRAASVDAWKLSFNLQLLSIAVRYVKAHYSPSGFLLRQRLPSGRQGEDRSPQRLNAGRQPARRRRAAAAVPRLQLDNAPGLARVREHAPVLP